MNRLSVSKLKVFAVTMTAAVCAAITMVAVVPHTAQAQVKSCTCCKGTGKNLCKVCGGRGCAQCNYKGHVFDAATLNLFMGGGSPPATKEGAYEAMVKLSRAMNDITTCECCLGTGINYTPAERSAMIKKGIAEAEAGSKAREAEKAKKEAEKAAKEEHVRQKREAAKKSITTFVDSRNNKTYKKVTIGNQTWMAENLNVETSGSVCYENSADNCRKYGRLYNWSTARTACPAGWHLPSDAEWTTLAGFVGGEKTAGTKLKSTSGWEKGNGTDEYGFSALPGGNGNSDGSFDGAGNGGNWWSATENDADNAWYRGMHYLDENVDRYSYDRTDLFSVRCVQDE